MHNDDYKKNGEILVAAAEELAKNMDSNVAPSLAKAFINAMHDAVLELSTGNDFDLQGADAETIRAQIVKRTAQILARKEVPTETIEQLKKLTSLPPAREVK